MSNQPLPKVSIIVTTFNNELTIDACLKSIFKLNYPKKLLEVLVIDGCSQDSTVEIVKNYPIKFFSKPLNAPAAYNFAIKLVEAAIIAFIDSDARVEPNWLNKLVIDLNDARVAGVSGTIETWNKENKWARSIGYDLKSRYDRIKKPVIRIATMNLLMKKSILEEIGGFDENLPSQYDTDLGFRISNKGYKILLNSKAKCYHFNRTSIRSYFKQQLQYGKNTLKLYFKHHKLIRGDEITNLGMNIQPPLFISSLLLLLLGLIDVLKPLWLISAGIFCSLFIYYVFSAVKLSVKFSDNTALWLIILYIVRVVAWSTGAVITSIRFLLGD
ncbi:MAG: glycosyltransferase, partial [Candidatus Bathyarchaeota archaeon]|nr:glycosyltransferase [Candidatus Bathyarchaeota archaeon]